MSDFTEDDLNRTAGKPRSRGTLPHLPDSDDPEGLCEWLTLAFRPPPEWRITGFERSGRDRTSPASLWVRNGRESRTYRFNQQGDLVKQLRVTVFGVADGFLRMPHLTGSEIEDVWSALCRVGRVLTEWDERDETRKWIEQLVKACLPLTGYTLVPDGRHDALMAIRAGGEFTRPDALTLLRPGGDEHYQQRPTRFIDSETGEQWLRAGEMAAFIRWVLGVEPLSGRTLRSRLGEVGVVGRRFEDYRPPHPKLNLYQLPEDLFPDPEGNR